MLFSDTLSADGGGSPQTPEIRIRSDPSSVSAMVSKRAVASGFA